MDLFQFDDDIFDISEIDKIDDVKQESPVKFEPRIPRWFTSNDVSAAKDNLGMISKFRADLAYSQQKYEAAIMHYKIFQEKVKDVNNLLWRASEEDISRCYIKLNDFKAAFTSAHNLMASASNIDQLTCSLVLMIDIYDTFGFNNYEKMIYLKKFLLIHPNHSVTWLKLGQCIQDLLKREAWPNLGDLTRTCFSISYLLEKKKSSRTFVKDISTKLILKLWNNLEDVFEDKDSILSYLEEVKSKYSVLIDGEKYSVVSIEHWSSNYLDTLKDDLLAGEAFDKKWMI